MDGRSPVPSPPSTHSLSPRSFHALRTMSSMSHKSPQNTPQSGARVCPVAPPTFRASPRSDSNVNESSASSNTFLFVAVVKAGQVGQDGDDADDESDHVCIDLYMCESLLYVALSCVRLRIQAWVCVRICVYWYVCVRVFECGCGCVRCLVPVCVNRGVCVRFRGRGCVWFSLCTLVCV